MLLSNLIWKIHFTLLNARCICRVCVTFWSLRHSLWALCPQGFIFIKPMTDWCMIGQYQESYIRTEYALLQYHCRGECGHVHIHSTLPVKRAMHPSRQMCGEKKEKWSAGHDLSSPGVFQPLWSLKLPLWLPFRDCSMIWLGRINSLNTSREGRKGT